ncbi:Transmembrane protein [Orchesella cincta]|uniref:Transmembrane protein n=1 Tax=Orchesella cincta TaxID=48709 RepID=A0A1D2ME79_ORCCI|nr:Transmembrane protein [Orchesella cincta]
MLIRTQGSSCHQHLLAGVSVVVTLVIVNIVLLPNKCTSLHVYGRWNPDEEFFLILSKFGFQKTELSNKNDTQGFIFGNFTRVAISIRSERNSAIRKLPSIPPAGLLSKVRVPRAAIEGKANGSNDSSSSLAFLPTLSSGTASIANTSGVQNSSLTAKPSISTRGTVAATKAPVHSSSEQPSATIPAVFSSDAFAFNNTNSKPAISVNVSSEAVIVPSASPAPSSTTTTATPSSSSTPATKRTTAKVLPPSSTEAPVSSSSTTSKPTTAKSSTTTPAPPPPQFYPATLVVVDRGLFVDFYRSRKIQNKDDACRQMFERISKVAHDPYCFPEGTENLLKRIPCPKNGICPDDQATNDSVVKGHQFTFAISDPSKAKFWYISLVPCYRDPWTCEWRYTKNSTPIDYDVWLVNGNPYTKNQNPLEYQFSFDRQDTVEIYLVFFLCYLVLVPLQIHAVLRQRHIVPKLFTASVALELAAVTSNVIHVLKFALDGEGHPGLAAFGDVMDIIARAIFMLILLVLAKGWAVTRTELTSKPFIFSIWAAYGVVHILLYVWKETEVDVIEDIDEYQTWPGWFILILRTVIMIWFLYELKDTMEHEHQPHKLNFFLHFGAAALVWFIYLPIVALIALQVSPLWRSKFLLGITYSADCLAFAIMTHLLWPTRTEQYFLLMSKEAILTDELEEFNEAPHVVNSYVRRPNNWYPVNYSFQDVSSPEAVSLTHGNTLQNHNHQYPHQRFSNGTNGFSDDVKDNMPLIIT